MGERCRMAALGATFALLVAACAATETPESSQASPTSDARTSSSAPGELALRDAEATESSICAEGRPVGAAAITAFDIQNGVEQWTVPIRRPGTSSVVDNERLYLTYSWDDENEPGVGALDLDDQREVWFRTLPTQPDQMELVGDLLVVVERHTIRGLDRRTGDDVWLTGSEFRFSEVVLDGVRGYAIDNVAVYGIDLRSGRVEWELPIERPDELAVRDDVLVVAAQNRIIAVDAIGQRLRWDQDVPRLAAGKIWVTDDTVVVQVAPFEMPTGGVVALDSGSGFERWRLSGADDVRWPNDGSLLTTRAAESFRGTLRYDLVSIDASTGTARWSIPVTTPMDRLVQSVVGDRALLSEAHPAVPDIRRLRLISTRNGSAIWQTTTEFANNGARIEDGRLVTAYRSIGGDDTDQAEVQVILAPGRTWTATVEEDVGQDLVIVDDLALVISGTSAEDCTSRVLVDPT